MNRQPILPLLATALLGFAPIASATESARHNDMDGDGRSDLIWRNASTGAIVYWSSANPVTQTRIPRGADLRAWAPVLALSNYWDNPAQTTLMLQNARGETAFLDPYMGTLSGLSDEPFPVPVAHGDFNGTGLADILSRNPRSGQNSIEFEAMVGNFLADGVTTIQQLPTVAVSWKIVGVGDFDRDGRSDILWRNTTTGRNAIWRSGNSTTQLAIATVTNPDWVIAAVGDYDGDGHSDIFWRNMRTGANTIWKSANYLAQQVVTSVPNLAWRIAATGDFNGDGKWDIAWRNSATGANVIWRSAQSSAQQTLPTVALSWSLVL